MYEADGLSLFVVVIEVAAGVFALGLLVGNWLWQRNDPRARVFSQRYGCSAERLVAALPQMRDQVFNLLSSGAPDAYKQSVQLVYDQAGVSRGIARRVVAGAQQWVLRARTGRFASPKMALADSPAEAMPLNVRRVLPMAVYGVVLAVLIAVIPALVPSVRAAVPALLVLLALAAVLTVVALVLMVRTPQIAARDDRRAGLLSALYWLRGVLLVFTVAGLVAVVVAAVTQPWATVSPRNVGMTVFGTMFPLFGLLDVVAVMSGLTACNIAVRSVKSVWGPAPGPTDCFV